MQKNNLVGEIYAALANKDVSQTPFSQCEAEMEKLYAVMESAEKKDTDLFSDFEFAQYELYGAVQEDAFCVGFRTAAQLFFQLIG